MFTTELGRIPTTLSSNYTKAPTVWRSIGALGSKLDQVPKQKEKIAGLVLQEVALLIDTFKESI
jgi:hypothetical protein